MKKNVFLYIYIYINGDRMLIMRIGSIMEFVSEVG